MGLKQEGGNELVMGERVCFLLFFFGGGGVKLPNVFNVKKERKQLSMFFSMAQSFLNRALPSLPSFKTWN